MKVTQTTYGEEQQQTMCSRVDSPLFLSAFFIQYLPSSLSLVFLTFPFPPNFEWSNFTEYKAPEQLSHNMKHTLAVIYRYITIAMGKTPDSVIYFGQNPSTAARQGDETRESLPTL